MPMIGAQREWVGVVVVEALELLPLQVRDVIADPETRDRLARMDPASAFRELERLLEGMQFITIIAWGFDDERSQELFRAIDALASLPSDPNPRRPLPWAWSPGGSSSRLD